MSKIQHLTLPMFITDKDTPHIIAQVGREGRREGGREGGVQINLHIILHTLFLLFLFF